MKTEIPKVKKADPKLSHKEAFAKAAVGASPPPRAHFFRRTP